MSTPTSSDIEKQQRTLSFGGFTLLSKANAAGPTQSKHRTARVMEFADEERGKSDDDKLDKPIVFGANSDEEEGNVNDGTKPLVIKTQANKDWRLESLKRRRLLTQTLSNGLQVACGYRVLGGSGPEDGMTEIENTDKLTSTLQSGLIKPNEVNKQDNTGETSGLRITEEETTTTKTIELVPLEKPNLQEIDPEKKIEAVALRALMGEEEDIQSSKVDIIPQISGNSDGWLSRPRISEDEAYRQDIQFRPEQSTLEDYERIPVHEFGAALLRGMGWKDGEVVGKNKDYEFQKPKDMSGRQALLGIGAKELPIDESEDALFLNKKKKSRNKVPKIYTPLVKVNKSGTNTPRPTSH